MSALNIKKLQIRTLSALVLIPFVLLILYLGGWVFVFWLALAALVCLYEWEVMALKCSPVVLKAVLAVVGVGYIGCSFLCCYLIFTALGPVSAILFLLMVWGCDIGAYFSGKFIGGAKLLKSISPNKTWAGLIGGLCVSGLVALIGAVFLVADDSITPVFVVAYFFLGALIAFSGQVGDFLISALKRRAGVKDTGSIIPGHGGLLDRVDSMLFASLVFYGWVLGTGYGF